MHLLRNGAIAVVALGAVYIGGVAITSSEFSSHISNLGLTVKNNSQLAMNLSDYTISVVEKSKGIFDSKHQIIFVSKDGSKSFVLPLETSFGFLNANTTFTKLPVETIENFAKSLHIVGIDTSKVTIDGTIKTKVLPFAYNIKLEGKVAEGDFTEDSTLNTSFDFTLNASQNKKEKVVINAQLSNIKIKEQYESYQNKDGLSVGVTTIDSLAFRVDRPIFEYRRDLGNSTFSIDGVKISSGIISDEELYFKSLAGTISSSPVNSQNQAKFYLTLNGKDAFGAVNYFNLKLNTGMYDLSGLFADADSSKTRKDALVADNQDNRITLNIEDFNINFNGKEKYIDMTNKYRPKELVRDAVANLSAKGSVSVTPGKFGIISSDDEGTIEVTADKAAAFTLSDYLEFVEDKDQLKSTLEFHDGMLLINGKSI